MVGELNITRGSAKGGIIQMVSSNASFSPRDIMDAADTTQTLFFQLYKNKNEEIAEKLVREVEELGYKAIFLTVDAVLMGNRERDIRSSWILEDEEHGGPTEFYVEGVAPLKEVDILGTAGEFLSSLDRDMTWNKAGTLCAKRGFVSDLFILDHSLATKDNQTSNRYQRFVFELPRFLDGSNSRAGVQCVEV